MLKKMLKVMVALGIFGFILSAGEGAVCEAAQWKKARKTQEKVYDVSGFTGVNNKLQGIVEVSQGVTLSVRGESSFEGLLDDLSLEVRQGILVVDASAEVRKEMSSLRSFPAFRLQVTLPRIEVLQLGGSGDMRVKTDIETERMSIALTGSGEIHTQGLRSSGRVDVTLSGSGDMQLESIWGSELAINLSGSGDVSAGDLGVANGVTVRINGSGDLRVGNVESSELTLGLSGSGDLKVGQVKTKAFVSMQLSGSGDMNVGKVLGETLRMGINGSGEVNVSSAEVAKVEADLSTSGSIKVGGGKSDQSEVRLSGSGDIDLLKHTSGNANVRAVGSGDLGLCVTGEVSLEGSSSTASITITGGARIAGDKGLSINVK